MEDKKIEPEVSLAAVAGHEKLAERIFALEAPVTCPECGGTVHPLGMLEGGATA